MPLEITKEQLLSAIFEEDLLLRGDIIAVTKTGSRLYNLETEKSDYDFKVIYLPSAEDIYYGEKGIKVFKLDIEGQLVEGQLISFKKFILDIGKPSLNSIEVLYDDGWYVDRLLEDVYADEHFLDIYEELRDNRDKLFYLNKGAMFNTLRGHLFSRKKRLLKSKKPEKEFMHFIRIYNILKALEHNRTMSSLVKTDGSLRYYLDNPESKDSYIEKMDVILTDVKEPEYEQSFNIEPDKEYLKEYHNWLIKYLFKEF